MHLRSDFIQRLLPRGVGTLASSNLVSQLCTLAVMPLLTRWCSLADFGKFQIYISFTTFASLVACLRYDYALLQPEDSKIAARLGVLAVLLSVLAGGLTVGVIPLLIWSLHFRGWYEIRHLVPVVAAAVAITGISSAATQWLVRVGRFEDIAKARMLQSVSVAVLQLGGALAGLGGSGLILGEAAGRLAGLILLLPASELLLHLPRKRVEFSALFRLGREYIRFPAVATPSALMNSFGFTLPVFFLGKFYGTAGLGVYSLLERTMGVPSIFIGQPLSQTFVNRLLGALPRGPASARAEIRATTRITALFGILPFGIMALAGPILFSIVFGEQWRATGQLAQWLAIAYFVSYTLWPVTPTLIVLNRLRTQMASDVARVLAFLGLAWVASQSGFSVDVMIATIVILMTGFAAINFWLCVDSLGRSGPIPCVD